MASCLYTFGHIVYIKMQDMNEEVEGRNVNNLDYSAFTFHCSFVVKS